MLVTTSMAATTYKEGGKEEKEEKKKEGMLGEAKNHNSLIDRIRACDELFLDEKTGGVKLGTIQRWYDGKC